MCVVEKGSEVGAHILSGNVFDPRALEELIPDWKEKGAPLNTPVTSDSVRYLINEKLTISIPSFVMPPMNNHGNYVISLGNLCRWLAEQAESLGVEIFPGFPSPPFKQAEFQIMYGQGINSEGEILDYLWSNRFKSKIYRSFRRM